MPIGEWITQFFTEYTGTPFLNELAIFTAENVVYLIPVALLYLWFIPERANARFRIEAGKSTSVFIVATIVVGLALSYALGQFHSHPAPYMVGYETLVVEAPENSFPSQHTTVVFAFAWALCYLQDRWRSGLVALFLASLVGISRVYIGVHYPIDILGGVGASLLGLTLVYVAKNTVMDFANWCIHIEDQLRTALFQSL